MGFLLGGFLGDGFSFGVWQQSAVAYGGRGLRNEVHELLTYAAFKVYEGPLCVPFTAIGILSSLDVCFLI